MKKGIHIMNPKQQKKSICHHATFYSIVNMSFNNYSIEF